jgi:hypothetical protein
MNVLFLDPIVPILIEYVNPSNEFPLFLHRGPFLPFCHVPYYPIELPELLEFQNRQSIFGPHSLSWQISGDRHLNLFRLLFPHAIQHRCEYRSTDFHRCSALQNQSVKREQTFVPVVSAC